MHNKPGAYLSCRPLGLMMLSLQYLTVQAEVSVAASLPARLVKFNSIILRIDLVQFPYGKVTGNN